MKRSRMRGGVLFLVFVLAFATLGIVACDDGKGGPSFVAGYATEVTRGDTLKIAEYIDTSADYALTARKEGASEEIDLTDKITWVPEEVGKYVLTYTVKSGDKKGTVTANLDVKEPKISWTYSDPGLIVESGDTLEFEDLFYSLGIMVDSHSEDEYDLYVKSVVIMDDPVQTVDLSDKESYTFQSNVKHLFRVAAKSVYGSEVDATVSVSVRYTGNQAKTFMRDNNMSGEYLAFGDDNSVILDKGSRARSYLPYIAYNGNFSNASDNGNFITVDFTGDNMPQVCFFANEVTPSLFDGAEGRTGIVISNGLTSDAGQDLGAQANYRLTLWGPYKNASRDYEDRDRFPVSGNSSAPSPFSRSQLRDGVQYRYIAGFIGGTEGEGAQGTTTVVLRLINLTTGELVANYTQRLSLDQITRPALSLPKVDFGKGYFDNYSIVLYGRDGITTKFDKVHPVIKNVKSIDEADVAFALTGTGKTTVFANEELRVSDYIRPQFLTPDSYTVSVKKVGGSEVDVTDEKFALPEEGDYTLEFLSENEGAYKQVVAITAIKADATTMAWLQQKEATYSGITNIGADRTLAFKNSTVPSNHMSEGTYTYLYFPNLGEKQSIEIEFGGKQIPAIAAYVKKATNAMTSDGQEGILFYSGMTSVASGTNYGNLNGAYGLAYGPDKMADINTGRFYAPWDGAIRKPFGVQFLQENKTYKMTLYTEKSTKDNENAVYVEVTLYDVTGGKTPTRITTLSAPIKRGDFGINGKKEAFEDDYFDGGIQIFMPTKNSDANDGTTELKVVSVGNRKYEIDPEANADATTLAWLQQNNAAYKGAVAIGADNAVTFENSLVPANKISEGTFSYLYFPNLGATQSIELEFSGKQIPAIAGYVKEPTGSITNGKQGILFYSGMTSMASASYGNLNGAYGMVYGPDIMPTDINSGRYYEPWVGAIRNPFGVNNLDANKTYRIAFSVSKTTKDDENAVYIKVELYEVADGQEPVKITTLEGPIKRSDFNVAGKTEAFGDDYFGGGIRIFVPTKNSDANDGTTTVKIINVSNA